MGTVENGYFIISRSNILKVYRIHLMKNKETVKDRFTTGHVYAFRIEDRIILDSSVSSQVEKFHEFMNRKCRNIDNAIRLCSEKS